MIAKELIGILLCLLALHATNSNDSTFSNDSTSSPNLNDSTNSNNSTSSPNSNNSTNPNEPDNSANQTRTTSTSPEALISASFKTRFTNRNYSQEMIDGTFHDNKANYEEMLTSIFNVSEGFDSLNVTGFKSGSIIVLYDVYYKEDVKLDVLSIELDGEILEKLMKMGASREDFKESLMTGLNTLLEKKKKINSKGKPTPADDCKYINHDFVCENDGTCHVNRSWSLFCTCPTTEGHVYSGERCEIKVEHLSMSRDMIIILASSIGGGVILILVIVITIICCKRQRGNEKEEHGKSEERHQTGFPESKHQIHYANSVSSYQGNDNYYSHPSHERRDRPSSELARQNLTNQNIYADFGTTSFISPTPQIDSRLEDSPFPYQPRDAPSAYQPRDAPSAYQPRDTPTAYQPRDTPTAYQPRDTPTAYQPRDAPSAYQPRDTPTAYQPRDAPSAYQPRDTATVYQSRDAPTVYRPRDAPSGYQPRDVTCVYPPRQARPMSRPNAPEEDMRPDYADAGFHGNRNYSENNYEEPHFYQPTRSGQARQLQDPTMDTGHPVGVHRMPRPTISQERNSHGY